MKTAPNERLHPLIQSRSVNPNTMERQELERLAAIEKKQLLQEKSLKIIETAIDLKTKELNGTLENSEKRLRKWKLKFPGSEVTRRARDLQAGVSVDFAQIQANPTETPPTPSAAPLEKPETSDGNILV